MVAQACRRWRTGCCRSRWATLSMSAWPSRHRAGRSSRACWSTATPFTRSIPSSSIASATASRQGGERRAAGCAGAGLGAAYRRALSATARADRPGDPRATRVVAPERGADAGTRSPLESDATAALALLPILPHRSRLYDALPALLLIRIGGESGEPRVLDGPTHREMVEVLVGEVMEAKDTMHGVVEVTPDTSTPNPGSFGF